MPTIQHIGYLGLGIMGSAMTANLLKASYRVTAWNRTPRPERTDPLRELGATIAASPADVVRAGVEAVCINVTDTPDVEAVLFGAQGVASAARPGLIVVDHSTISPDATQDFARRLQKIGVTLLDAPVSGGDVGARNATLSIMVGGDEDAFQRCLPMLQKVGRAITHLGPSGMGQVCKACNQIAVSLNLLGVCEALALAKKSGLDLGKMIEVVSAGAAGSWQLTNLGPRIARGDLAPGFMIDLVLKDLAIVADAAREQKLPLTGAALAETCFRAAAAHGHGRSGTQAMSKTLEILGDFEYAKP